MKILIVGGGPGGLYAALLIKKAHPGDEVHLVERNPAGATYGWGVVFSDRTLNAFREADHQTYEQITESFVTWQAIDTAYRDRVIRCDGHTFAGLARQKLLQILQERGRALGVELAFEQELTDVAAFAEYDLVIAADGVKSLVRGAFADAFRPSLVPGRAKYIWFGTDRVLDAFTFLFRENEHGLFQAHAYPFDGTTSTFIVECAEDVWRAAGLDQADEAGSIAYCQALFADFLGGGRLLSNRSLWTSFVTVRNKTWRHENVVLLGDAAHTAHFSVGSGTRLAMEGAISLARALVAGPDLDNALNLYEMDRRPRVELLQEAAAESQHYFENIRRYLHLDPIAFTTNLLTRSGRIHYDNLRLRDPFYVDAVDRHFSAALGARRLVAPPPMFTPFRLRAMELANRVAVAPPLDESAADGLPSAAQIEAIARQAAGGAALVLVGPVAVDAEGRITPECAGLYAEAHLAAWQKIVAAVHAETPARIGLQLNHAGRRGATRPRREGLDRPLAEGGWPLLAPSPLAYTPAGRAPRAMDRAAMAQVIDQFAAAAGLADRAGFDLLQLHFGHGYLLSSFLSPLANRRDDAYGGPLENRLRFPLELFDRVRAAWPAEKPLAVALNATDWARGGLEPAEAVAIARTLKDHGCDLVEALAGQTTPDARPVYGAGFLTHYSEYLRHEAQIPTLVGGYLTTSGQINTILAAGRADLCVLTPRPDIVE